MKMRVISETEIRENFPPEVYVTILPKIFRFFRYRYVNKLPEPFNFHLCLGWDRSTEDIGIVYDALSVDEVQIYRNKYSVPVTASTCISIKDNWDLFWQYVIQELNIISGAKEDQIIWHAFQNQEIKRIMSNNLIRGKFVFNFRSIEDYLSKREKAKADFIFFIEKGFERVNLNVSYVERATTYQSHTILLEDAEKILVPYEHLYSSFLDALTQLNIRTTVTYQESKEKYEALQKAIQKSISPNTRLILEMNSN